MSSSNSSRNNASGGIGFCGLLAIAFIVLKIIGVINWSWLWVLSPIWIPTLVCFAIIIFAVIWMNK